MITLRAKWASRYINGGSIEGNGDINVAVNNSGLLNPRHFNNTEFGRLGIQGNYTDSNTADIDIQIGGSNAGVNFDQIDINGGVDVHSTLNASLSDGFSPTIGDRFEVINYNSITHLSQFQFTRLDIPNNQLLLPEYWDDRLTLTVTEKPLDPILNVTTNQDLVNDNDGVLSLREAIITFNRTPFDNTIILDEDTYTLGLTGEAGKAENFAKTGDLDILPRGGHLTIQGQGIGKTILDAASIDRFFEIHQGASLTISGVTITGGKSTSGSSVVPDFLYEVIDYGDGGGIFNAGTLNLSESELVNNQAIGNDGSTGSAGEDAKGGAIYNEGELEITNSTFSSNQAIGGDGGNGSNGADGGTINPSDGEEGGNGGNGGHGQGGAIFNSGELTISGATFSDNHVIGGKGGNGGDGGKGGSAIYSGLDGGDGGNGGNGGDALEPVILGVQDPSQIINNTVANNHCTFGMGGEAGSGGAGGDGLDEDGNPGLDGIDGADGECMDTISSSPTTIYPDFNFDGKRDLVWRNQSTGKNVVWYMDGANRTGFDNLPQVANLDWQVVGTGDANDDQKTDLYWRNQATGKNVVWYMDGATRTGFDELTTVANTDWEIVGIGDADNDSLIDDIYWRNQAIGKNVVWYMDGTTMTSSDNLPKVTNLDWQIVGIAEGNGDGKTDLYWRNQATGKNVVWYMDGVNRTGFDNLPTVANTDWEIVGTGDGNGDGKTDLYWRNQVTGQNVLWYMDGVNRTGFDTLPQVANTDWEIVA